MSENACSLVYLPWLKTEHEIIVGDYHFWPFRKLGQDKVPDTALRDHLCKIFDTYVEPEPFPTERGKTNPVGELTVATRAIVDFTHPVDFQSLSSARDALAFVCMDQSLKYNWCTGENFELVFTTFFPGDMEISYRTGGIVPIKQIGWRLGDIFFQQPLYVNGQYTPKYDQDLLTALSFGLTHADRPEYLSILRSLHYFRQAYMTSDDVSPEARVLLMMLAFEILLGLGAQKRKRKDFREKIHSLCGSPAEETTPYQILNTRTGALIETESLTKKQIWAEEYYKLRDRIVHGDQVLPKDFSFEGQAHFQISTLFFRICVRRKLEALGATGNRIGGGITINEKGRFEFDVFG